MCLGWLRYGWRGRQAAAPDLVLPPPAWEVPASELAAGLAALGGYYDQAHLHRDLLSFTGYSPSALLAGVASDDPAFWPYRLAREQLQSLFGPGGY